MSVFEREVGNLTLQNSGFVSPHGDGTVKARSTGSHCGGTATGWSVSASLLATQGLVRAAQKVAATPMRASARKLEARFFAYRSGGSG